MIDGIKWDRLDRYFSGELSPEEAEAIERWAAVSASRRALLASAREAWELTGVVPEQFDAAHGWEAIRSRLSHRGRMIAPLQWARAEPRPHGRRLAVAAAAAILVGAAALGSWRWSSTRRAAPAPVAIREYVTARGERGTVLLADGSRVWVNAGSRLRVAYAAHARDVYLDGEATFTVTHDSAAPFRVHTTGAVAEDLGTEFVVRAYAEDSSTTVVVVSGAVTLQAGVDSAHRSGVTLTRGQLGRVGREAFLTVEQNVDVDAYRGWQDGRLQFQDVPLAEVARTLERWYDVDITLADSSLGPVPVRATFLNQSVDEVLGILARSVGGRYARSGEAVRLFVP